MPGAGNRDGQDGSVCAVKTRICWGDRCPINGTNIYLIKNDKSYLFHAHSLMPGSSVLGPAAGGCRWVSGGCIIKGTEPVRRGRGPAPPPVPAGAAPTQIPQGPGPARGSADTSRWTSCQPAKQASPFLRGEKRPGSARCLYLSKGKSGVSRPPGQGSSHLASRGCLRPARLPPGPPPNLLSHLYLLTH